MPSQLGGGGGGARSARTDMQSGPACAQQPTYSASYICKPTHSASLKRAFNLRKMAAFSVRFLRFEPFSSRFSRNRTENEPFFEPFLAFRFRRAPPPLGVMSILSLFEPAGVVGSWSTCSSLAFSAHTSATGRNAIRASFVTFVPSLSWQIVVSLNRKKEE